MEGARRHVTQMVVPLVVLAAGLFVLVLVPYGYPLRWATLTTPLEDVSPFLLINACAGLLAISILLARRRDSAPGRMGTVIALIAILAASVMTAIGVEMFSERGYWTEVLVFAAPLAISLVVTFHALRARGWDRMFLLLGAFAIAALPYSCPLIPGAFNLFSGGLVYLAADLALLVLFIRGWVAR